MHVIRFVFPFLFVRNWYNGTWEFSRTRFILTLSGLLLLLIGVGIAYMLSTPVVYTVE